MQNNIEALLTLKHYKAVHFVSQATNKLDSVPDRNKRSLNVLQGRLELDAHIPRVIVLNSSSRSCVDRFRQRWALQSRFKHHGGASYAISHFQTGNKATVSPSCVCTTQACKRETLSLSAFNALPLKLGSWLCLWPLAPSLCCLNSEGSSGVRRLGIAARWLWMPTLP